MRVDSRTRESTLTALEHMASEHIGMHQDVQRCGFGTHYSSLHPDGDDDGDGDGDGDDDGDGDGDGDHHPDQTHPSPSYPIQI